MAKATLNRHITTVLLIASTSLSVSLSRAAAPKQYLFLGHPRDDGPGEIVQRPVERIDFAAYDLLLLGGDLTWLGTGTRQTVAYLDALFDLSAPTTLATLGNHDTSHRSYFTDVTGRPAFYAFTTNRITFVVLDTSDNSQDIVGDELLLLQDAVGSLNDSTHLVVLHHHFIWLSDYPPLAGLIGSPLLAASSANLSGLNFYDVVYPLLLQARSQGVEVLCLAGDRTGSDTEEFYIDHTTAEGVRFIGAGLMEELSPELRTVVVLEHDVEAGTLAVQFKHLAELPRIPDEPLLITELHYHPSPAQGDNHSFIELFNRGSQPYDLSGARFTTGITFTFPDDTVVEPGEFVVVAADPAQHGGLASQVFDYEGAGRPASGEPIWLRDRRGVEIDHVDYGTADPWPESPDDTGPSLMLIDPGLDNSQAAHWAPSDQAGGTPGSVNIVPPTSGPLIVTENTANTHWNGVVPMAWYQLDFTPTLDPPDWRPTGPTVPAVTSSIQLDDSVSPDSVGRYFRLRRIFTAPSIP